MGEERFPAGGKLEQINLTDVLTALIQEVIARTTIFTHCVPSQMTVCMGSNRSGKGAVYGKLVPLRFRDGAEALTYRGTTYAMPRVISRGIPQLYLIYFYYPRFFDLPPGEKLRVVFHELYHISPRFNGDIRRMAKVKASHGGSRKLFDRRFEHEMKLFHEYIAGTAYMNFLDLNTRRLHEVFGKITGRRMKIPRPMPAKLHQKV